MTALLLALLPACKPPPDAPDELDELVGYMYEHNADEETDALEAGAVNLDTWLVERIEETAEGYTVQNLSEATIAALGEGDRELDGLVGASVGHVSPYTVEQLAQAAIGDNPEDIFEGTYTSYEREVIEGDVSAFLADDEDWLYTEAWTSQDFSIVQIDSNSGCQYRWIDTPDGRALVQRNWSRTPPVMSVDWLAVEQQYYQWIVLPEAGGSRTLQTTWVVATMSDDEVPEDVALNMVVDSMIGLAEDLDAWVESGGTR